MAWDCSKIIKRLRRELNLRGLNLTKNRTNSVTRGRYLAFKPFKFSFSDPAEGGGWIVSLKSSPNTPFHWKLILKGVFPINFRNFLADIYESHQLLKQLDFLQNCCVLFVLFFQPVETTTSFPFQTRPVKNKKILFFSES